jgi:transposase-like protein
MNAFFADSTVLSSLQCVRWYGKYAISYRQLGMRAERGIAVDHTTIRWGFNLENKFFDEAVDHGLARLLGR